MIHILQPQNSPTLYGTTGKEQETSALLYTSPLCSLLKAVIFFAMALIPSHFLSSPSNPLFPVPYLLITHAVQVGRIDFTELTYLPHKQGYIVHQLHRKETSCSDCIAQQRKLTEGGSGGKNTPPQAPGPLKHYEGNGGNKPGKQGSVTQKEQVCDLKSKDLDLNPGTTIWKRLDVGNGIQNRQVSVFKYVNCE